MKLGSLFDGIGGFPLVGSWYGFDPVWASEIEDKPISITKRHLLLKIRSGCEGGGKGALIQEDLSATLGCNNDQTLFEPAYCIQGNCIDRADTAGCNGKGWREDVSYTLNTMDRPAVVYENNGFAKYKEGCGTLRANGGDYGGGSENIIVESQYSVRRLTPLECERLQGFPDNWTKYGVSGELISDTQRYKALGNSVALPCVEFVLSSIAKELM